MTSTQTTDTSNTLVYIIDDDPSMRAALDDLLASVGLNTRTYSSVQEFLDQGVEDSPGCLILDIRMPGQSGMDFHRHMAQYGIQLPTIFITGHGDIALGVEAMKNGAIEFLTKPFRDQDLLDAIQLGLQKDTQRRQEEAQITVLRDRWNKLTTGEQSVMRLVVQGLLNKQIASHLHVSEITVKVRRGQVMRTMEAGSLAELVRMADRLQLQP
ncbi:response regulator transcription factor [Alcaligenaceae bacterium 429]|nr:response regulator transcription factor [Alcaligenaceae bacterium 429]